MGVSFQEQSRKRKVLYAGLILALLSVTVVHKLNLVNAKALEVGMRQEQLGAVELYGSSLRLMLTGSRGLAVCGLWWTAMEKQKKHEWNKLSTLVRSLTRLQPHFITPWEFQSWNLAYNVSVENDRIRDKYFYITEGMALLADGERKNRNTVLEPDGSQRVLNHPELCFYLGFYYQQKIGTHDNQNTLLSLLQLSAMDPRHRDPANLRRTDSSGRQVVDLERFAEFCQRYPILVRRLREVLRYETPEEIVDFLAENQKLPTRFEEESVAPVEGAASRLKPLPDQFPVLALTELTDAERQRDDSPDEPDFSTFTAARGWFHFAQRPLPETDPTFVTEIKDYYDKTRYRMPKKMMHLIFRGYPARAQDYVASHLQREGWFDEAGWPITGWFPDDEFRTGDRVQPAVVGQGRKWAEDSWDRAYQMYRSYGQRTGLYIEPTDIPGIQQQAQKYREAYKITYDMNAPVQPSKSDPLRASWEAHERLFWYERNRQTTNFPHFFYKTMVEAKTDTIRARKAFHEADRLRNTGQAPGALRLYSRTIPEWRKLLRDNKEFRRDQFIQEETYQTQQRYLELARSDRRPLSELLKLMRPDWEEWRAPEFRKLLLMQEMLAKAGSFAALAPIHLDTVEIGPFDWYDNPDASDAQPFISDSARQAVQSRK